MESTIKNEFKKQGSLGILKMLGFFVAIFFATLFFKGEEWGIIPLRYDYAQCDLRIQGAIKLKDNKFVYGCLKNGFNPNHKVSGYSLMHAVALTGNTEAGELILKFGGRMDLPSPKGALPLEFAIQIGNKKTIAWFKSKLGYVQQKQSNQQKDAGREEVNSKAGERGAGGDGRGGADAESAEAGPVGAGGEQDAVGAGGEWERADGDVDEP